MKLEEIKDQIPEKLYDAIAKDITELRPAQEKAIEAGLLVGKSLLICTPTASGKTLVAELAMLKSIMEKQGKALYIAPLKALASEKYRDFKEKYSGSCKVALSIGDFDSSDSYLIDYDLIITTSEKLDSLTRHHAPWLRQVKVVIVDEIHLLNDPKRGPTLEIILTILKSVLKNVQVVGLSATIGNPKELSDWLEADLVQDNWRPVVLKQGVYLDGHIDFKK